MDEYPEANIEDRAPCTFIDVEPENSVVVAPSGRVFVYMSPMLHEMVMQVAANALMAKVTGDHDKSLVHAGEANVLRGIMETQDKLALIVTEERMRLDNEDNG